MRTSGDAIASVPGLAAERAGGNGGSPTDMARRSIIVALGVIAAFAALLPAGASAATAPAVAPVLTSAPFATLVSFQWTPGNGVNLSQSVYRSIGPCATPVTAGHIADHGG